jgi:hypothetical protein
VIQFLHRAELWIEGTLLSIVTQSCCNKLSFIHQTYNTHTDTVTLLHTHYSLTTSCVCPSYNTGTDPIENIVHLHSCVHDYYGNVITLVTVIHNNHLFKLGLINYNTVRFLHVICENGDVTFSQEPTCLSQPINNASSSTCHSQSIILHCQN